MINFSRLSICRFVACLLSFAIVQIAPGLAVYQAIAQTIRPSPVGTTGNLNAGAPVSVQMTMPSANTVMASGSSLSLTSTLLAPSAVPTPVTPSVAVKSVQNPSPSVGVLPLSFRPFAVPAAAKSVAVNAAGPVIAAALTPTSPAASVLVETGVSLSNIPAAKTPASEPTALVDMLRSVFDGSRAYKGTLAAPAAASIGDVSVSVPSALSPARSAAASSDQMGPPRITKIVELKFGPANVLVKTEQVLPPHHWSSPVLKASANVALYASIQRFVAEVTALNRSRDAGALASISSVRLEYLNSIETVGGVEVYSVRVLSNGSAAADYNVEVSGNPGDPIVQITKIAPDQVPAPSASSPTPTPRRAKVSIGLARADGWIRMANILPATIAAAFAGTIAGWVGYFRSLGVAYKSAKSGGKVPEPVLDQDASRRWDRTWRSSRKTAPSFFAWGIAGGVIGLAGWLLVGVLAATGALGALTLGGLIAALALVFWIDGQLR